MAKGFTVKAKTPTTAKKEAEWDYDAARQMVQGKQLYFAYLVEEYHMLF